MFFTIDLLLLVKTLVSFDIDLAAKHGTELPAPIPVRLGGYWPPTFVANDFQGDLLSLSNL